MRKLVLAIAVVASFASCEKSTNVEGAKTGMIQITPMVKNTQDLSKKGAVNRGTTPVYVSSIDVNTDMSGLQTDTHFDIVDDASGVDNYVLQDVPLGQNTISAVTNPKDGITLRRLFQSSGYSGSLPDWTQNEVAGALASLALKAGHDGFKNYTQGHIPPYAIYTGSTNAMLIEGQVANAQIDMDTEYGRSLFSVNTENAYDLANYTVTMRAKFYDKDGNEVYNHQVILDHGITSVIGMWSDELSVEGARIDINFKWTADNGDGTILNEKNVSFPIHAKSDMYTRITLNRSTFVIEQMGLTFTYDPIVAEDEDIVIN